MFTVYATKSFALASFTMYAWCIYGLVHICQSPEEQDAHHQLFIYEVDAFDLE